jgi:hypothetical protein
MKVKIGNYPWRLRAAFYEKHMNKKYGYVDWPDTKTKYEQCLDWLEDRVQNFYDIFNRFWFDRCEQKVSVRIDPWDTWSMDVTLAHIVVPMLKQLKETKHGAPCVDYEDVPEHLRQTKKEQKAYKENGSTDDKFFERWDWVMGEMIFAFESKLNYWEDQFMSGESDIYFEKVPGEAGLSEMKRGTKDTFKIDHEGMKAYQDRISNGFRLFGKYFEGLWD